MQTIMVGIVHIAEGNTVERVAKLVLIEAADRQGGGIFIIAKRIGAGKEHARKLFDQFQGARARGLG